MTDLGSLARERRLSHQNQNFTHSDLKSGNQILNRGTELYAEMMPQQAQEPSFLMMGQMLLDPQAEAQKSGYSSERLANNQRQIKI